MSGHRDQRAVDLVTARAALLALARPTAAERVQSEAALGRVVAEPAFARIPAPHYRGSAMDGIAVDSRSTRAASAENPIVLVELPQEAPLPPHAHADARVCCVVDTGSPLPDWADAVVRNEATNRTPAGFEIVHAVAPGRDVRAVGEDVAAGAPLLPRGHRVRPFDIGALLATAVSDLAVRRRPTVGVLATGGEIVEPGGTPGPGEIVEYNSRMLAGFVDEAGGEATYLGRASDDARMLAQRVREASVRFDLVCVIAGSSRGRKDFTLEALADCGEILFRGVGMVPGRPTGLAVVGNKPVLAIPGYPVSAVIAYRELVGPFLAASLAMPLPAPERMKAVVRRDTASRLGIEEMLRVCLAADGADLVVAPLPRGAGSVTTLVRADGILRIPANSEGVAAGATVEVELLRPRGEIGGTIVVAGEPHELFADLEDAMRSSGAFVRFAYLGLSDLDATSALAAGESHCALFRDGDAGGLPSPREMLSERLCGWRGYELRCPAAGSLLLALTPRFAASELACTLSGLEEAARRCGFVVTKIAAADARS
jgi:putative molybdopterin biosynthesis protein